MKVNTSLINQVKQTVGILIIILFVIRFFIFDKPIIKLDEVVSIIRVLIIIGVIISQMLIIKTSLYSLLQIENKSILMKLIIKGINFIILNPLNSVKDGLLQITIIRLFFDIVRKPLISLLPSYSTIYSFTFCITIFPKTLLLFALSCELLLLNQVHHFYTYLILIVIPITHLIFFSMLEAHCIRGLQLLTKNNITLEVSNENDQVIINPKSNCSQKEFKYFCNNCEMNLNILNIIETINLIKQSKPYLIANIMHAFLFIICWSYCLINLNIIT